VAGQAGLTAAVSVLLAVVVGGVSLLSPMAYDDLDSSWVLGLTWWFQHKTNGSAVYFTYGPLGWLTETMGWARPEAVAALLFMFAVTAALACLLLLHLRRSVGWLVAIPVTAVILRLTEQRAETLATITALTCLLLVRRHWQPVWLAPLLGGWCALVVLVKPGAGAMALVCAAAFCAHRRDRLRSVAVLLGATAATLVVGWLVLGQPIGQLAPWLWASEQLASGYWIMMIEAPGLGWQYPAVALLVIGFIVATLPQRDLRWRSVAIFLPYAYLQFKHGFISHGDQGNQAVIGIVSTTAAALPDRPLTLPLRTAARLVVAAVVFLSVLVIRFPLSALSPGLTDARALGTSVQTLVSGGRWNAYWHGNVTAVATAARLSPPMAAQLVGGVQVDPWSARTLWPDIARWQPVPIFQQYIAYTPWLDRTDAHALEGAHAPTSILHAYISGLLERSLFFDAPAYQIALVCHYSTVSTDGIWALVRRTPANRCGAEQLIGSAHVAEGRPIAVPAARDPRDVVVARFDTHYALWWRTAVLLLKPPHPPMIDVQAEGLGLLHYRIPTATLDDGLLVRLPPAAPSLLAGATGVVMTTLTLRDVPVSGNVSFYEIPYS
jgi:hypothetical protein